MQEQGRVMTVSELTQAIKGCLESGFRNLTVRGELSELTVQQGSGHVYFSIKDSHALLRGVAFRYGQTAVRLGLRTGMDVEVSGRLVVYEPRGEYQIYATRLAPGGMGELYLKFEELRNRLGAEGLFDPMRKRPLPALPRVIGLITGSKAAAFQDFMNALNRRFGGLHVRFVPSLVQGDSAPPKIIAALNYLNRTVCCDVIVITRGGGSMEDLWCFNDENLVRAVAASDIPVVSAVGHDRDTTLCDLAADVRAPTPTAAAEFVIRGREELGKRLENADLRMRNCLQNQFAFLRQRYVRASQCRFLTHPDEWLNRLQQRLDYATQRLETALPMLAMRQKNRFQMVSLRLAALPERLLGGRRMYLEQTLGFRLSQVSKGLLENRQKRLEHASNGLRFLNPQGILTRGYSILLDDNGSAVRSAADVADGSVLRALLGKGEMKVEVKSRQCGMEDKSNGTE